MIHFPTPELSDQFYTKQIKDLHVRRLRIASPSTPVYECAIQMAKEQISCLFVGNSEEDIEGFITDITLRDQLLAKRLSSEIAVSKIMEKEIVSVEENEFLSEALLLMFRTKSRYLLVRDSTGFRGWISRTKILTEQSQGPFLFVQSVKEARQISELKDKWNRIPEIIHLLIQQGMKSSLVNQIITTVADTITQHVIERVIKEIGQSPAKFVFFVMGSEGRGELTLKTDQDNAIIYEDKANEQRETVRAYFLDFATRVSEGLNEIGIVFCEGELMAKNPKWTHSLSHWKRNYETWISDASQETAMNYATFFDCRAIYGEIGLLEELKEFMDIQLQTASERFYVNLGYNALQYEPPLTFFKQIKTEKIEGKKQLNLKHTMRIIVDLARVFALKHRVFETNTGRRLEALGQKGVFTSKEIKELIHAFEFLMTLRLQNQSHLILQRGKKPKNHLAIDQLTKLQHVTLIEIFKIVRDFQTKIKISFTGNL